MGVTTLDIAWAGQSVVEGRTEAAARHGDRAAWNELIARHDRRVVLVLLSHGVLPAEAKELAQEAWLRLIRQADARKLERLELPGLVVRQALYLARSESRRMRPEDAPADASPPTVDSAETRYVTLERLARARERLATLPHSARAVFELLYGEPHLSHAEVAARVGLSVQRVRQIICEVRKELRAELEEGTGE